MDDKTIKNFSAYTSLFNHVTKSIFVRDKLSNQVTKIFNDENGLNLDINDEKRLKRRLYSEIRDRYNDRIKHYGLNLDELPYKLHDDDFEIKMFQLKSSTDKGFSGYYEVYPRTFVCKNCGSFKYFQNSEEFKEFNPNKCGKCGGKFEQFSFVSFCDECGSILASYMGCKEHKMEDMVLIRGDKDDLKSWVLKCNICGRENSSFTPLCMHRYYGDELFKKKRRFKDTYPINLNDQNPFQSVVITTVDIPEKIKYNSDSDYVILGLAYNRFDSLLKNHKSPLKYIMQCLDTFDEYNLEDKENLSELGLEKLYSNGEKISKILGDIKKDYENLDNILEMNDYLILMGLVKGSSKINTYSYNTFYKNNVSDLTFNSFNSVTEYLDFINVYGLSNITYIPNIHLISSSIGFNRGINKMEDGYVPHFEPHWLKGDKFEAISYPFETEGIMIDLDKIKIVNWLIDNKRLYLNNALIEEHVESEEEAKNILINLKDNGEDSKSSVNPYKEVKILLHTFSHMLINNSSIYTGLDSNSCSEILFPNNGAFLIYSINNINIGGFQFVFENSLKDWFGDVKLDIKDCVFDPTCIHEGGACFSCLHLSEHVCAYFNEDLNRDTFIGEKDYKGFWIY